MQDQWTLWDIPGFVFYSKTSLFSIGPSSISRPGPCSDSDLESQHTHLQLRLLLLGPEKSWDPLSFSCLLVPLLLVMRQGQLGTKTFIISVVKLS